MAPTIWEQVAQEAVEVTDRQSAEGLHHFALHPGDIVVTDAGYQLGSSVQQGRAEASLRRTSVQQSPGALGAGRWPEARSEATDQASEVWDGEGGPGGGVGCQPQRALCHSRGGLVVAAQTGHASPRAQASPHSAQKRGES